MYDAEMNVDGLHRDWVAFLLGSNPDDFSALAVMALMHTHNIALSQSPDDRPGVGALNAITQRHAATLLATSWPDEADSQRTDPYYWFARFNAEMPYELVDDMPNEIRGRVEFLREQLEQHPTVTLVSPED